MASIPLPAPPAGGGHYVLVGGKPQLIHAIGKGKWAPGAPPAKTSAASNPLLNPSQPLSGQALQQAATQLTNAQINGPVATLAAQLAQNSKQGAAQQKQANTYFQGLGNFTNQSNQALGNVASGLNSQLAGIGQDTQARLAQLGQDNQASVNAHAPAGEGSTLSPVQSLAADLAKQSGYAAQDSGTARATGAMQGANYQGLGAANLANYAQRGQEAIGQIGAATQKAGAPIQAQIAGLQSQRGALQAANEGKLRQQEISNAITAEGIQAGLTKAQIAAAQSGANALTAANQSNVNNQRSTNQSNLNNQRSTSTSAANSQRTNATSTANGILSAFGGVFKAAGAAAAAQQKANGGKPLTPSEQNSYWSRIAAATQAYGALRTTGESPQTIIAALKSGGVQLPNGKTMAPMNDLEALATYELWTYHYLNPQTASLLHRAGVRGGTYNGAPIKVGGTPNPTSSVLPGAGSLSQQA